MAKSCGPCCAPMFLRIALGIVFVWAGLGKVCGTMPVKGDDAAALANMGVITPPAKVVTPTTPPPKVVPPDAAKPDSSKPDATTPDPAKPDSGKHGAIPSSNSTLANLNTDPVILLTLAPRPAPKVYTAEDFPDEVQVKPLYGIALAVKKAASSTDAEGKAVKPIWPAMLGRDRWPVYQGWSCALAELVGGLFLLVGFLTRISALTIAFNMGVAMWLTQIGPAIASGNAKLGILPNHDWLNGMAWTTFNYILVLILSSLALMMLGAGRVSVDRVLFPPPVPLTPRAKPEDALED
jgi:uncharacterized membrane protein YphA (DoxX/SURF4 family)